jgi:rubrerythrin
MTDHKKLRTKLAQIKEKSESLMCELLDSEEEIVKKLSVLKNKSDSNTIRLCIDIVMAELTYIMYTRALDDIDENTGGKNANSSDW